MTSDSALAALSVGLFGYLCGGRRSRTEVHALEALLVEELEQYPWFEDLELTLALYNPGSGEEEYFVDDQALEAEIRYVLTRLGVAVEGC